VEEVKIFLGDLLPFGNYLFDMLLDFFLVQFRPYFNLVELLLTYFSHLSDFVGIYQLLNLVHVNVPAFHHLFFYLLSSRAGAYCTSLDLEVLHSVVQGLSERGFFLFTF